MLGSILYVPKVFSLGLPEGFCFVLFFCYCEGKNVLDARGKKGSYNLYENNHNYICHNCHHIPLLRQLKHFFLFKPKI